MNKSRQQLQNINLQAGTLSEYCLLAHKIGPALILCVCICVCKCMHAGGFNQGPHAWQACANNPLYSYTEGLISQTPTLHMPLGGQCFLLVFWALRDRGLSSFIVEVVCGIEVLLSLFLCTHGESGEIKK